MEQRELRMREKEKGLEEREKQLDIREGACIIKEGAVRNMRMEVSLLNIQKNEIKTEIVNCKREALVVARDGYELANRLYPAKKAKKAKIA